MHTVPERMRAVAIERVGGPEELCITELPTPQPGPGEVLVRVAYADVNPADWKCREGWLTRYMDYRFPFVLGFDGAGIVAALGDGVDEFNIGDRVTGTANQLRGDWGSYAQFFKAAAGRLAKLPDNVDLRSAAAIPIAGVTAWEGIVEICAMHAGQQILINGGAGGVGSYAIQLARWRGARVAATASATNLDYVNSRGVERAIEYRGEDVAAAVRDWAPQGVVSPVATLIDGEPTYNVADAAARNIRIAVAMSNPARAGAQLRQLIALLAAGDLRAPQIETLSLAQAAEAHARIQRGHVRGKLLLAVEPALEP